MIDSGGTPVVRVLLGLLFGSLAGYLSYRAKLLTGRGAVAAAALGSLILSAGGAQWALPLLGFFIPSSLISRFSESRRPDISRLPSKNSRRDAIQVLCNGGPGGALAILWIFMKTETIYLAYLGALAAAAADTWATEVGTLSSSRPVLVSTFRAAERGTSGAISFSGTMGGLVGAATVCLSAVPWIDGPLAPLSLVLMAGMAGMLVDSALGATVQASYACPECGKRTEVETHCGVQTSLAGGVPWMSNDSVNVFCSMTGGLAVFIVRSII